MNIKEVNNKIDIIKEEINKGKIKIDNNKKEKESITKYNSDTINWIKSTIIAHLLCTLAGVGIPYCLASTPDVTEHKITDLTNNELMKKKNIYNYESDKEYKSILTITSPWTKSEDDRFYRNVSIYSSNNKHDLENLSIEEIEKYFVLEQNTIQYKDNLDINDDTFNTSVILDEYSYKGKNVSFKNDMIKVLGLLGFILGFLPYLYLKRDGIIKKYRSYKLDMKALKNQNKEEKENIKKLSLELQSLIIEKERLEKEEQKVKSLTR